MLQGKINIRQGRGAIAAYGAEKKKHEPDKDAGSEDEAENGIEPGLAPWKQEGAKRTSKKTSVKTCLPHRVFEGIKKG